MPKLISLYTGVGGLDFGFEAAGFETAAAVEIDATACSTIRLNRSWPLLEGDIHSFILNRSKAILGQAGLSPGQAELLIGGPPCQPFSKSGYWANGEAGRMKDPRASTLSAWLKVLEDALPRAFLLENVRGLTYKGKSEGLDHLVEGIEAINARAGTSYRVNVAALNAADYGVPQLRERVFLIGSRDGRSFTFPEPTHGRAGGANGKAQYRTAWDAIGDLPPLPNEPGLAMGGKWADLLPSIPEGQNYLWHTPRMAKEQGGGGIPQPLFGWRTRYWSFLLKLAKNQPSWTIQAQPGSAIGPFHWNNRKLSTQELCRLQTFPDDLKFDCGRTMAQKLLGNAVPSLLAEILAREIGRQLLDLQIGDEIVLLPPVRTPVPPPEPVEPVAKKFLSLATNHAEHPGTGLGPSASNRGNDRIYISH